MPEWFDPSYSEGVNGEHYFSDDVYSPIYEKPVEWANVFFPAAVPLYQKACELAQVSEARESRADPDGRPGLWVSIRIANAVGAHF